MGKKLLAKLLVIGGSVLVSGSVVHADSHGYAAPVPRQAMIEASRLAGHVTYGLNYEAIEELARKRPIVWLDEQFAMPPTHSLTMVNNLMARRNRGEFRDVERGNELYFNFWRNAWWHTAMTAPDVVRQRIAFALSEIFVVSSFSDGLNHPWALPSFYDTLLDNAFGNFRDLLYDITMHPSMGIYLSHVNNSKSDPENNKFPDENFAREVMQLFTIGLYELNIDGSLRVDAEGQPIPTYDNDDIREFAKVFTGLSYGGPHAYFGRWWAHFTDPMQMFDEYHEPGEKRLLNGHVIPDGQTGMQDINDAVDNLFNHPNVGPFIARHLLQRLVTSNPAPDYIERVARAFNGDSTGVRGDMRAVLMAILSDQAVVNASEDPTFGKLREPALRILALARQFNATSEDGTFFNQGYRLSYFVNQHPMSSPSVFNFYSPNYAPAGVIADQGMVAPEFEISTANTLIGMVNMIDLGIFHNSQLFDVHNPPFKQVNLDLSDYVEYADDVNELVDRLDVVMTYGRLSLQTRNAITSAIQYIGDHTDRVKHAIYLVAMSADYAVMD